METHFCYFQVFVTKSMVLHEMEQICSHMREFLDSIRIRRATAEDGDGVENQYEYAIDLK